MNDNKLSVGTLVELLKRLLVGIIIAGIIIFFMGAYYLVIKAGIPYQNPTMEMQIEYAVNNRIGDILSITGVITAITGIIIRILVGTVLNRKHV